MAKNHVTVIFDRKKKASENGIGKIELQIRLTRTCRKYITVDECTIQEWKARKISKNVIAEQNRIEKIVSAMECLGEDMTMENLNKHLGLETIKRVPRPKAIIKVKQEKNPLKESFLDFMRDEIIKERSKESTKRQKMVALDALERWGKIRTFEDLTPAKLREWDEWLRADGTRSDPVQTAAIEKRYDKEISQAEGNIYKVAKLEKQKEREIAKAKNEANKKMFAMQVIQAVAQTAQNAISAYGSAAAIPIVAIGALQIAAIKKQQQASEAQGYAKGGFTPKGAVDEEVGVVHAGEWVASQKLLANPVACSLINALDYAQRTNTIGSLRSADVSKAVAPQVVVQQVPVENVALSTLHSELSTAISHLNERLNEPFVTVNTITGDTGIKKAQDEYDKLIRNKTPKSKQK